MIRMRIAVAAISILSAGSPLYAQELRTALRDRPSVVIQVRQVDLSVASSLDIDVILTNLTGSHFDVRGVTVELPEALRELHADTLPRDIAGGVRTISPGSEILYRLRIPSAKQSILEGFFETRTLLFTPGEYVVSAEVEYVEPPDASPQSMYTTYQLSLKPPLSAVLRGGVLGALLLAIFVPAYRVLHGRTAEATRARSALQQAATFLVAGSVVSIIAILLLQRVGGLELPVNVAVNDYLGGVIIGLFSYKIGDVLFQQFFVQK